MREHFHVPENYFLSHSVGCMPKIIERHDNNIFLQGWKNSKNWDDWMPILDDFRTNIGNLLSTSARNICPQTNISSALTKIIFGIPKNSNKRDIILSKQDFPTVGFVLKQAEKIGYSLKFVEGDPSKLENWINSIDENSAIVHITHALSNSSHILPVEDICQISRQYSAITIIDIAQSINVVPISVRNWQADFIIGTGVKFLCAGPGTCFLYASDQMIQETAPIDVGWFSHSNPFEMDIGHFQYATDAMRFFGGTPSPAPLAMANISISLWNKIGFAHDVIQNHLDNLLMSIDPAWIRSPVHQTRGGTFVVSPPNAQLLRQALNAENYHYDERNAGFRFSVHGYNSPQEIKSLASIILRSQ